MLKSAIRKHLSRRRDKQRTPLTMTRLPWKMMLVQGQEHTHKPLLVTLRSYFRTSHTVKMQLLQNKAAYK